MECTTNARSNLRRPPLKYHQYHREAGQAGKTASTEKHARQDKPQRWTKVTSVHPKSHCPAPDMKKFATLDGSRCMNVRRNKTEPHFVQSTKLRKATPPRTPRSMFLDFLRPGVRSGFECLRGRRHARPSVPTTGTNTPETLNGGCGGSVAFLLVLIVQSKPSNARSLLSG